MKQIFLIPLLIMTGCNYKNNVIDKTEDTVFVPTSHEYGEVSDYELTWDSIFDPSDESYYVYIYSTTCTHCEELKNYIIEKALNRGDIYFVKGSNKDQLTNDSKKLIGAENPGDIYILGYPSLLLISNHKCTKNLAGSNQIKSELK